MTVVISFHHGRGVVKWISFHHGRGVVNWISKFFEFNVSWCIFLLILLVTIVKCKSHTEKNC